MITDSTPEAPRAHKPSCSLWDFMGKKGQNALSRQVQMADLTDKIDGLVRKMQFLEMMGFMMNADTHDEFKTCETSLLKLMSQREKLSDRPVSIGSTRWY